MLRELLPSPFTGKNKLEANYELGQGTRNTDSTR